MQYKITLILLFSALFSSAQTTVTGYAKNQEGQKIKVLVYDDFITYKTIEIKKENIDSLGVFNLSFDLKKTTFCILETKVRCGVYLEPNKHYELVIPAIDTNLNYNREPIYVSPEFKNQTSENINFLIAQFNAEYDEFVAKNLNLFIQKTAKNIVDTFYFDCLEKYSKIDNPYFKQYLNYTIANIRSASSYSSKKKLYNEYFASSPVLYHNDSYMDFFNQFYKEHLKSLPVSYQNQIVDAIKIKMDLKTLDEILKTDEYLQNDTIRELVIIKSLMDNYRNPSYSKKGVLMILNQVIDQSTIEDHKKTANNIRNKLSSVDVGSFAPEFELADLDGNMKSLSELSKHKYVYMEFWATWCAPCVKEMKMMPELYKEFGDDIEFVSISIDKKAKTAERFINKNDYNWTILHIGENEELLELYKTKVIPTYFLIAPGGKVIQSPAERPSSIRPHFEKIKTHTRR